MKILPDIKKSEIISDDNSTKETRFQSLATGHVGFFPNPRVSYQQIQRPEPIDYRTPKPEDCYIRRSNINTVVKY